MSRLQPIEAKERIQSLRYKDALVGYLNLHTKTDSIQSRVKTEREILRIFKENILSGRVNQPFGFASIADRIKRQLKDSAARIQNLNADLANTAALSQKAASRLKLEKERLDKVKEHSELIRSYDRSRRITAKDEETISNKVAADLQKEKVTTLIESRKRKSIGQSEDTSFGSIRTASEIGNLISERNIRDLTEIRKTSSQVTARVSPGVFSWVDKDGSGIRFSKSIGLSGAVNISITKSLNGLLKIWLHTSLHAEQRKLSVERDKILLALKNAGFAVKAFTIMAG